jgi:serine protease AprX
MRQACPTVRWRHLAVSLLLAAVLGAGLSRTAHAYRDTNANKIDDVIEDVNLNGWSAAFEHNDPAQRMRIGVENPQSIVYAIYVRYDHKPTALDQTLLRGTGVSMAWPFLYIHYIESRATFAEIVAITALPGVTRVEAVPVEYAMNHYGSRVVRARESLGLSAAENYALFPSARTHLGLDGTGVVIAILDTGVNDDTDMLNPGYPGHESLKGKFLGGGEFWCGQPLCSTAPDASANPQDHGGEASSYHATHVAGTALGTGGPGGFFAGVAPGARLVDCKVLSDAGASVGGSNRGIEWVIANRHTLWSGLAPGSIWQGIDVVSMSLGSPTVCQGGSGTEDGASSEYINVAVDSGLVVVIATGNESATECISTPASADQSIAVGASTHNRTLDRSDDRVTDFSNEGPRDDDGDADHWDEYKPSVVAPGAGIISAFGDPTTDGTSYQQLSGTSMATPCVSGCVALLLQANPALTPLQVRTILQNTAEHNIPTVKATGDRGQDPYGIDANYDPSCGWGLVDIYAGAKEALNSTSGVQVVQIAAKARPDLGRIDVKWITQREYPLQGFNLYRAPDAGGSPGTFVKLNPSLFAPIGNPNLQGVPNRHVYPYADSDPALALGQQYWYQVEWVDLGGTGHLEPPVAVAYGTLARVATAYYAIAHNAVDNDLTVRVGADLDYSPGALGGADFEILGPGENAQDSAHVVLPATIPPNTGTSTLGTIEHFWSVGFKQGDGAEPYLPPTQSHPWFLNVMDGGYVNRTGRVTAFSLFVNDAPGSASGTTYVTDHMPMPQPLIEGGEVAVTLWIPEMNVTAVPAATFTGVARDGAVRLTLTLPAGDPGATASVYRSRSEEFATRELLTPKPIALADARFEYDDRSVVPGVLYHYWIELRRGAGDVVWNGPIALATPARPAVTLAGAPWPNPVRGRTSFEYTIGADAAASGPADVSLAILDVQGRLVRTLKQAREGVGTHRADWDATDGRGVRVGGGVYYLQLRAGGVRKSVALSVVP